MTTSSRMTEAQRRVAAYNGGSLYLSGCDLTGVTLPESIGGSLDLRGCDLTGVTLPKSIGGSLDLRGCDLTGVTLPESIGGSLDLSGCDLTGVTLPKSIGGSLDLSGCDLTGVTLPESIGGSLYLSGCDLTGIPVLHTCERGYELRRVFVGGAEWFVAGCRTFKNRAAALAHWSSDDYPNRKRGDGFVAAINATSEDKA